MPERKPTPPQACVLQAAAEGLLSRLDGWGYKPVRDDGKPVREVAVKVCLDSGWLRIAARQGALNPRYFLTDLGAAVLARHNVKAVS